jgi:hypothetical protein
VEKLEVIGTVIQGAVKGLEPSLLDEEVAKACKSPF